MISDWYSDQFVILNQITEPDGYGNSKITYINGKRFMCGFAPAAQAKRSVAQQGATAAEYKIAFDTSIVLKQGMMVKRMKDGAVFEVMNDSRDYTTPAAATAVMAHSEARLRRVTIP